MLDSMGRRTGDALLGAATAIALALIIALGPGGTRSPDVLAYLFAGGLGALLLCRRQYPRTVLVLSILGMFGYYILDYPPIGVAVPVVAALFSVAEAGRPGWACGAAALVFAVSLYFRIRDGGEALGFLLGYESVSNLALFAAAIALGSGLRSARIRATQQEQIARLTRERVLRESQLRMRTEREDISRELHDTVGHSLSIISLHTGVAAEAIGHDDTAAARALEQVRATCRRSLQELRAMVRILRTDEAEARSPRSLSNIAELMETARASGLQVTADIEVTPAELSESVDAAAFRVIQESITNIIRHAHASRAHIGAALNGPALCLSITDDGRGRSGASAAAGLGGAVANDAVSGDAESGSARPADGRPADAQPEPRPGYGIAGMTERVELLGGTLSASATATGFTVAATIPARLP